MNAKVASGIFCAVHFLAWSAVSSAAEWAEGTVDEIRNANVSVMQDFEDGQFAIVFNEALPAGLVGCKNDRIYFDRSHGKLSDDQLNKAYALVMAAFSTGHKIRVYAELNPSDSDRCYAVNQSGDAFVELVR